MLSDLFSRCLSSLVVRFYYTYLGPIDANFALSAVRLPQLAVLQQALWNFPCSESSCTAFLATKSSSNWILGAMVEKKSRRSNTLSSTSILCSCSNLCDSQHMRHTAHTFSPTLLLYFESTFLLQSQVKTHRFNRLD